MKITVRHSGVVRLAAHYDKKRGELFVAEAEKNIPFPIRRVYFIINGAAVRGGHAHRRTNQVFFAVSGSFVLGLDDGKYKQKILLKDPSVGVIIGAKLWHTMSKFSKDCVLLAFADRRYDEKDYVRTYDDFKGAKK